jgi:antitoxin YqcF
MDLKTTGPKVAQAALGQIGGAPTARRYGDEDESHWVDIAEFADRPMDGYATYSTLSLHGTPNPLEGEDIRVEIAGVAPRAASGFPDLLSTAAFFVIKDHWLCAPGVVFPGLLPTYYPALSSTLEHLMFVGPFPWQGLSRVEISRDLAVHWLLAMPISEAERRYLLEHGYDRFEELFEAQGVEYYDLDRPSVV